MPIHAELLRADALPARSGAKARGWALLALIALVTGGCSGDDAIQELGSGQGDAIEEAGGDTDTAAGADGAEVIDDASEVEAGGGTDAGTTDTGAGGEVDADADAGGGGAKEKCNGVDDDNDGKTDEDACNDGLPCTEDVCDTAQQFCVHSPISDAGVCDDGDPCTGPDGCKKGVCTGAQAKDCGDGDPCTDDGCASATGLCDHAPRAAGATCDDGDACTAGDTCVEGKCTAKPKSCDDGDACTVDSCDKVKGCAAVPNDGAPCDDGDACTASDACAGGQCKGAAKACVAEGACQVAACDPSTGDCKKASKPDGSACTDDNLCTQNDACSGGACKPEKTVACPPGKACIELPCDPASGLCLAKLAADGAPCDDGDACTAGESCKGGNCSFVGEKCNDQNPCTADVCEPGVGCKSTPIDGECSDGDLCTIGDACKGGKCAPVGPKGCDDKSDCSVDSCDATTGNCVNDGAGAQGKPCNDDGSACTTGEICTQGKCLGGSAKVCKDNDPCTSDGCDPIKGDCAFPPAKVGTPCADGSFCTFGDACDALGKCTGTALDCNDQSPCTADGCDPKTGGCLTVPLKAGDGCEEGDLCSTGDTCDASGACIAGKAIACDDGNLCTNDSCDKATGKCATVPNKKPCDDNSICTSGESCNEGACKSGIDGDVSSIAGSGILGHVDGAPASARFSGPRGIAWVPPGPPGGIEAQVVIADSGNHRLRLIGKDGNVSTLAGQALAGLVDGTGANARFSSPVGVAIDPSTGTVVIGDRNNHALRRATAGGAVTTVAGVATNGFVDGKGNLARFYYPEGVTVAANGDVYVADRYNHAIRVVTADGTVSTLAGSGQAGFLDGKGKGAQFYYPSDVALDSKGVIFVSDASNNRIRAVLPDGTVSTIAGSATAGAIDGFGADARFNSPDAIAFSPAGYLIVVDRGNHRLRKVTKQGMVSVFSGSGQSGFLDGAAALATFSNPYGVAVDASGRAWVSDHSNQRIRRTAISATLCQDNKQCTAAVCDAKSGCTFSPIASGKACEETDSCATGGTCDAAGECKNQQAKCTDDLPCALAECDVVSGSCKAKVDGTTCNDGDTCTTGEACLLGVCSATAYTVVTDSGTGASGFLDGAADTAVWQYPRGGAVDSAGGLIVADSNANRLRRLIGGQVTTFAGDGNAGWQDGPVARFSFPADVAASSSGWIAVADRNNHRIRVVSVDGQTTTLAGSGQPAHGDGKGAAAHLYYPEGLDVTAKGDVIVADTYNNRVRRITADGTVTTLAGNGGSAFQDGPALSAMLYRPGDVLQLADGAILISDTQNMRIRRLAGDTVTSLAGSGSATFADGTGSAASFYYPQGLAAFAGQVLVADRANHRLRLVHPVSGKVTTFAGAAGGFKDGLAPQAQFNSPFGVATHGDKVWVVDSANYRIRRVNGPQKDCDDGVPCTTDSCDAKAGTCKHVVDPNCCSPLVAVIKYEDAAYAKAMTFETCSASKLEVEPVKCVPATGEAPELGWQVAPGLTQAWSAPGALYYGDLAAGNYDFGPSGGKVITGPMKVPTGGKKLTFRVWFDTEPQAVFDRLYAFLRVDGQRVKVLSNDPPSYGAAWYKGSPGFTTAKTWGLVEVDVSPYVGKTVSLEFTFNTGDGLKNFGVGVVIDDVTMIRTCGDG